MSQLSNLRPNYTAINFTNSIYLIFMKSLVHVPVGSLLVPVGNSVGISSSGITRIDSGSTAKSPKLLTAGTAALFRTDRTSLTSTFRLNSREK